VVERARIAVLFVDKNQADVTLAARELGQAGLIPSWERVEDAVQLRAALERRPWDFVVADSNAPQLGVFEALALTRALAPATPFIVLSASIRDSVVEIVRRGAVDFVPKRELPRLTATIVRELARPPNAHMPPQITALLVAAREAEARRIASDLHDRLGQLLAVLARAIEDAQDGEPSTRAAQLASARNLANEAIRNVRELSTELWPLILDDLGLRPALRWLAERYSSRLGFAVTVALDEIVRLPPSIESACYRIAEAALANVARHAQARAVEIRLRVTDHFAIELAVTDDGRGFDPDAAWQRATRGESLGLVAMRERAILAGGVMSLVTAPGTGTTVRVSFAVQVQ
jgi:signal transduction histidine kinase